MKKLDNRGQVIVFVLIFFVSILAACGLAVDIGFLYLNKGRLQNAGDAAVLAGVRELGPSQSQTDTDADKLTRALQYTYNYLQINGISLSPLSSYQQNTSYQSGTYTTEITFGWWNVSASSFTTSGSLPYRAVRVTVRRDVPTYFIRIVGISSREVVAQSIARVGRAKRGSYGLLPIGILDGEYSEGIYQVKGINFKTAGPGYKGILNFDRRWVNDESQPEHKGSVIINNGNGSGTWENYIGQGYPGPTPPYSNNPAIDLNQRVDCIPGNHSGPFREAILDYIDNSGGIAIVPLVDIDSFQQSGTNESVMIVRFAAFYLQPPGTNDLYGQFIQTVVAGDIDDSSDQNESDDDIFAVKLAK